MKISSDRCVLPLKLVLGIGLIALLFYKVGIKEIVSEISRINIWYLPLILFLIFITQLIGSFNFLRLISKVYPSFDLFSIFKLYTLSWALSLFAPGKVGELSLVWFIKKRKIPIGEGLAFFIIDKAITFSLLILISCAGLFFFFSKRYSFSIIFLLSVVIGIFCFFVFSVKGRHIITKYILRKYSINFAGFSRIINIYKKEHKKIIAINFLIAIVKWVSNAFSVYFIFIAFDARISLWMIMVISAITVILALIPITLNGLGVREVLSVVLYSKFGMDPAIVTGMSITLLVLNYSFALMTILLFNKRDLNLAAPDTSGE